jgi:hypothetical protein
VAEHQSRAAADPPAAVLTTDRSFMAKVARARRHLRDLEAELERWLRANPYAVSEQPEGRKKRKPRRLVFTSELAATEVPIIAADAIYDLRSSLDHLMNALVARRDRGSVVFPVYFQGVWDAIVPGESPERIRQRLRWAHDVRTLPAAAVAILRELQPPEDAREQVHLIEALDRLCDRDRHERLPVAVGGLVDITLRSSMPDGSVLVSHGHGQPDSALADGAALPVPDDAVAVFIEGTPRIGLCIGDDGRHIEIPARLWDAADLIEAVVIPRLAPFLRKP